jgi:hypothetical protein
MDSRGRVLARRVAVAAVVALQVAFVVRGFSSPHQEFAFRMFSESSTFRADIVRVTADGRRIPISEPWSGYEWDELAGVRGLAGPAVRHHADAGIDNQLSFLAAALDWVADHTPRDTETRFLEATVTYWRNTHGPEVEVLRSHERAGVT